MNVTKTKVIFSLVKLTSTSRVKISCFSRESSLGISLLFLLLYNKYVTPRECYIFPRWKSFHGEEFFLITVSIHACYLWLPWNFNYKKHHLHNILLTDEHIALHCASAENLSIKSYISKYCGTFNLVKRVKLLGINQGDI